MKKIYTPLLVTLIACAFTACSTVAVTTNYDEKAPFGKYKTYILSEVPSGKKLTPASQQVLSNTVRTQLAARGITEAKQGRSDLAIVWNVITKDKISAQESTGLSYHKPSSYGSTTRPYMYGAYDIWQGAPPACIDVKNHTEGTLVMDVVDRNTNKLVFRGSATAIVGSQKSNAQNIEKAVVQMVSALPIKNR